MPSRWMGLSATTPSASSSRASSRASSPTHSGQTLRPSYIMLPRRRDVTFDSDTSDYLSRQPSPHEAGASITPGGSIYGGNTLEIVLDADRLVLRGQGGDMNPAYLSGRVELKLVEATNIKEINMTLTGKAKVQFSDGPSASSKHRHFSHPIISHDWSFLQGARGHSHTLKAGHHSFPFSFMLDGNLPSSLHSYTGDAVITYKLRAQVVRSGFSSNFSSIREFSILRMFTPEALEFNQTLEIENTWPGKIMYSFTLPYKAYAAGDDIPVNVKFMPLAKGVKVTTVVSVLKEYTLVHTRHSSHPDTRVDACVKHEIRDGMAVEVAREPVQPPHHWIEVHGYSGRSSTNQSRHTSPTQTPISASRSLLELTADTRTQDHTPGQTSEPGPSVIPEHEHAGSSMPNGDTASTAQPNENVEIGDEEVNTFFNIPIPPWVTPSHSTHPVFVTHKIKWSCSISNPDGHVSELRCALPIIILDNSLLDEARMLGATTRGLLFGGVQSDQPPMDLPSYSNHVYDRIAVADSGNATGFIPRATSVPSSYDDTPQSRAPSRPGSPTQGISHSRSGNSTPAITDPPSRRQLSNWVDSELLLSLGALQTQSNGNSPHSTPDSQAPSRPLSRSSRSNFSSRAGSRASSPERNSQPSSTSGSYAEEGQLFVGNERRSSGLHGLFHLPLKPINPLSQRNAHRASRSILLNNNSKPAPGVNNDATIPRNSSVPNGLNTASANASGTQSSASSQNRVSFVPHHFTFKPEGGPSFEVGDDLETPSKPDEELDPLNQVPPYRIASQGFLGGGIVPLDTQLPTYGASQQLARAGDDTGKESGGLVRHRSDTALVQLGAQAAAAAEARAAEDTDENVAPVRTELHLS
ncbi:uncharacterized protein L203_105530 [Cryptococcus depauperatus CBS 7841]|uniref:Uncharacterized protein n=1 Tax=Cryptococcus depauperatus CBS 7841 TaxID=1295531 RepID=A0A1E3IDC9_9TREE|nr:hypothetical protein L203_04210 [Cryptococcus depauperatus CBS 7841]